MLDALQFETEIKGGAIKTLTEIQELLGKISQKTIINIDVQGVQDFQKFVQSEDFKNVAKNISSAFGGAKAKNVEAFFTNLRTEIEKVKTSLKSDDYSNFINQIGQLTQKFNELSTAYQSFLKASGSKTGEDVISDIQQRLKSVEKAIAQLEPAYKKLQKKQEDLEKSQDRLSKKQEDLGKNVKKTTEEVDKQSVAMDGLQRMMNRYLSIYAVGRFASEMAQITGELELQKRSLEVIIGNADKANELYSTIRDMSQMSPYTFQDLMKSTRQLSAFGIETRDLYDTMKALSDIGAGLSVDVQRLILAYGHTRSYGYLSGIQNRQFETAGIDMIGGLVDYYNKLADAEERAGRAAERFTRKDVFKKMSKREISFEDVNAVIMDLDREGGKFFNMQERQFETLGGKLRNLRNNYNIMMSEMGEQNNGILRGGVELLNELTGNWEKYALVIKSLILPLGMLKLAMIAANRATQEGVSLFSAAGWENIKKGGGKMLGSLKAMLTSAGTWITAAIAAITAVYVHFRDMSKEAERVAKNMAESAERSAAEMDRILQNYNGGAITVTSKRETVNNKEVTSNEISFNREAMKALNLGYELEELKRKLQAISPFYEGDLVDIFKLQTQEEQFEAIIQRIESYRKANDIIAANEDNFAESNKGGFFKGMESLQENAKDYAKSIDLIGKRLKNMREEETLTVDMLNQFNKELKGVLGDGTIASKAENLRKFFVNTLAMSEEDRQKLFLSWSDGLKTVYADAFNMNEYAGYVLESGKRPGARLFGDVWRALFGSNAMPRQKDLEKNMENVAKELKDALEKSPGDYTTRIATIRTNFVASTQDSKLPEDVSRALFESLLQSVSDQLGNTDYTKYMETKFEEEFGKRIEAAVKNNPNWTREQASSEAFTIANDLHKEWENQGRDDSRFWNDGFREGLQESAKSFVSVKMAWQDAVQNANFEDGKWNYSDFYDQFSQRVRDAGQTMESAGVFFGDTMKKVHDDLAKEIEMEFKPAEKKWGITIEPDFRVETKNLDKLRQLKAAIDQELKNEQEKKGLSQDQEKIEGLTTLSGNLNQAIILEDMALQYGVEYSSKGKGSTSYKAEFEKRWDERIRVMKEAYGWYEKWDKEVGESKAFEKVDARYRDIFDEWKTDKVLPFDFKATDIKDYFKYVEQIRDEALAKYNKQKNDQTKNNGQEALRVYRQAVAVLEEGGYDNFVKAAEKFQSIMEKTMDDLQRRWSIFTDVRDKTGNVGLAASLSGVDTNFRTQADAMRDAVQQAYEEAGGAGEVNFDISLDKEAVRSMFEGAIPGDKNDARYLESINGLIKGFEEWQKSEQEQEQNDINITVDLLGSAVDFQSEVGRLKTNYDTQLKSLQRRFPNGGTDYDKAKGILDANYLMNLTKAEEGYKLLMDGVTTMSQKAARVIKRDIIDGLTKQLEAGAITAKEYADGIQAVSDNMSAIENNPGYIRSFFDKGFNGIAETMGNRAYGLLREGKISGADASKMMMSAKGMSNTLAIIDAIINGINKMVQSLKGFADYIKQVNVALGRAEEGEWTRRDTALYAFSNASQQAANGWNSLKEGDIIGALQGTYGSWAEWWKSIAEGDDKEREYQIKISERELKILSNMEARLDKIAERTLGYGGEVDQATWDKFQAKIDEWNKAQNGETYYTGTATQRSIWGAIGNALLPVIGVRAAESIYDKNQTKNYSSVYSPETIAAMQSALQTGSLYGAQYAAKMMERDELTAQLKQLEAENNKDNDRIEETKQKLWNVKQELAYFAEDLAKQLWGIDLKGWADQISDALMNAFVNGENAAKAFDDTMRNIMQDVVNETLKIAIIEPMIGNLRKRLFGTKNENGEYEGGAVTSQMMRDDPQGAGRIIAKEINDWRQEEGNAMVLAYQEAVTGANAGLNGYLLNPNANTLSASIQGTSEETSNLLAGYVSAMRQDVAADRIMREQFLNEIWPTFIEETMGAIISPLNNIDRNVASIQRSMTGNGELIMAISDIYEILNSITNGTKEVHMA